MKDDEDDNDLEHYIKTGQKKLPQRNERGHWVKGSSGNPSGSSILSKARAVRKNETISQLAKHFTEDSLLVLHKIAMSDDAPAASRVSAANALLDRAWGKPAQTLEVSTKESFEDHVTFDVENATTEQLEAIVAIASVDLPANAHINYREPEARDPDLYYDEESDDA